MFENSQNYTGRLKKKGDMEKRHVLFYLSVSNGFHEKHFMACINLVHRGDFEYKTFSDN